VLFVRAPTGTGGTDLDPFDDSAEQPVGLPVQAPPILLRADLKRQAAAGVFIVGSRGLVILLVAFGGTVILAHLLDPHDFGLIAIGTAVVGVIALFSDGGLGASLIRRRDPPTTEELQALTAFQLGTTVVLTAAVVAISPFFGEAGWVAAIMAASTPIVVAQFPGKIVLERTLSYRPLALVEVGQVVAYYFSAVAMVSAGAGVWGLACATIVMRIVGAITMARVSPVGIVAPRFSWGPLRHLLGFGLRFQAASAIALIRDQGMNTSIAVIASATTLGLWTLARRLLEIPNLLFEPLLRVSFPTMSKLIATKGETAQLIERVAGMAAIVCGVALVGLAASAPGLVPGLFGEKWKEAATVIPAACFGLAIVGPVLVAAQGYLFAAGDASLPLRANIAQAIAWFAVTLPLLPFLGVSAVGIGWLAGSCVEAFALSRGMRKRLDADLVRPVLPTVLVGVVSAGAGWLIADRVGADLVSGILGGAAAVGLYVMFLLCIRRRLALDTYRFAATSIRAASTREGPAVAHQ
jgi:O-antigen/teichoic acid export membrane protein